jgi:hypothetical protein
VSADPNRADAGSETPILSVSQPGPAHNGGQILFGPDGLLYIGLGDGGSRAGEDDGRGQSLGDLLGSVLRIDASAGSAYSVPGDNPFVGTAGAQPEIWSYGLRNPWRFSFDRLNGDLLIGDVGQDAWEEIDFDPAPRSGRGVNWGWDCREGRHDNELMGCVGGWIDPILEYPNPGVAAVTGGYVVRDPSLGDLYGRYLYADIYTGQIHSLVPSLPNASGDRSEGLTVSVLSSFGEDSCGRVYVASHAGPVSRLVGDAPADCNSVGPPATTPTATTRTCAGTAATRIPAADGTVIGTAESDVIVGDKRRNKIRAKGGDDLICAGGGADRIKAGRGRDTIRAGAGRDRCDDGPGKDKTRSC